MIIHNIKSSNRDHKTRTTHQGIVIPSGHKLTCMHIRILHLSTHPPPPPFDLFQLHITTPAAIIPLRIPLSAPPVTPLSLLLVTYEMLFFPSRVHSSFGLSFGETLEWSRQWLIWSTHCPGTTSYTRGIQLCLVAYLGQQWRIGWCHNAVHLNVMMTSIKSYQLTNYSSILYSFTLFFFIKCISNSLNPSD